MLRRNQILVVTDRPLLRDAIDLSLERSKITKAEPTHAPDLDAAIAHLKRDDFCLIMLDLPTSQGTDFDGLLKLKAKHAENTPVIVVSSIITSDCCVKAKHSGAAGMLGKNSSFRTIEKTINCVIQGESVFPSDRENQALAHATIDLGCLTPAQKRVIAGLSDGLLNKQIAYEMGIAEATVKAHMTAIFRKLGASNRPQAMLIYSDATHARGDQA